MMNSNLTSLVRSAIGLFDPTACLESDYEAQVASVTEVVADLQQQNHAAAMELDPQTLANLLGKAAESHQEVAEVLNQFASEIAMVA